MHYLSDLDNPFRDFRYAIRSLRKDRRFVTTAVFALALGIGAATVAFSAFYNLRLIHPERSFGKPESLTE
jgi:hypothetical protein